MNELKTKAAAPIPPVGADGEQPVQKTTGLSIAEDLTENNPPEQTLEEKLRLMQRMSDPAYLHTVSMSELYENVYQSRPPVIDGLLYSGTYLFVGAPKVGKSFFMAQLAYHVSTGIPLWIKGRFSIWLWRMTTGGCKTDYIECSGWTVRRICILLSAPSRLALAWMNSFRSLYGSTLTQS